MVSSVTRLGDFLIWKFLAANLTTKVTKLLENYLGYHKKHHILSKTAVA